MAVTGLFLCLFLIAHLIGNLQLIFGTASGFNQYAHFMTSNPVIKMMSYLTYLSIVFHALDGILLTFQNKKARPIKYAKTKHYGSSWASRNMALLGTLLLVFIILHLQHFWAKIHFGVMPIQLINNKPIKDLYLITIEFFQNGTVGLVTTLFYIFSMFAMAFHLHHGFSSAFQSLGIYHTKYNGLIKKTGFVVAYGSAMLFAFIPVYIRFIL